jgi:hypothetical protein
MSKSIENRAAVKVASREKDEGRLARREISPQDLQKENSIAQGFRKDVIGFGPKLRPKSVRFIDVGCPLRPGHDTSRSGKYSSMSFSENSATKVARA